MATTKGRFIGRPLEEELEELDELELEELELEELELEVVEELDELLLDDELEVELEELLVDELDELLELSPGPLQPTNTDNNRGIPHRPRKLLCNDI